ncbi:uncharacterized protein BDFB_008531 [Asbolus verrucosus]|uniref:Uncharacterized protein n=1 Tax=Asbolus verrucosus TaxID=1661398 RepID=A0A482VBX5_ASBVE|nr:uncharacterized protein BDFB_008531 [Asbolus verrucosus]
MSAATLLLREEATASLATLVEKSQNRKPPLPEYELQLNSCQLDLVLKSKPETNSADEGFESDIDSLSIVSSDGSFTPETKTTETDSANGSASSDSDTENSATNSELVPNYPKESYNLVECVCYTDVKFPDVLVFVIKQEALVFKFENLNNLRNFYLNFTALKAVTNQKAFNKNSGGKFNLLQRTDNNGRPERRKKIKGKAPPPPAPSAKTTPTPDVLRGEYVRVNVSVDAIKEKDFIAKSQLKDKKPTTKQNLVTLLTPKPKMEPSWTNSVPRLLKKQRSKSETRSFTPMAYRYIDTAPTYSPMSNRLFGLSPKLRDFGTGPRNDCRWNSVGELSYKSEGSNLKSVIKKDENRKKNEKKVTFSAYTTVQVV